MMVMILACPLRIKAQEEIYRLVDYRDDGMILVASFADLDSAYDSFLSNSDEYDNLVLYENDDALLMEYGMVIFNSDKSCSLKVDLNEEMSFNPCYAIDALYLSSQSDLDTVTFLLAGERASIARDEVTLQPYSDMSFKPSRYSVSQDELYHDIKNQWELDYYAYHALLSSSPAYLEEGHYYYSYDGRYFYDDFYLMSDDQNAKTYDHALNKDDPYYNYYAYLPMRSYSNYSYEELETYFEEELDLARRLDSYTDKDQDGANDIVNRSQLAGSFEDFYANQNLYGANALLLLAISINESAYGKSQMAYSYNNLFSDLALSTSEEREAGRYKSIASSIYAQARYIISNRYANNRSEVYAGTFLGSPQSGLNRHYSSDPYWGEKVAGIYYELDLNLGQKDAGNFLAIKEEGTIRFYEDESLSSYYYETETAPFAFLVIEEGDNYYKVAYEPSLSEDDRYDFEENVAYIAKDGIKILHEATNDKTYHTITFDAGEGTYREGQVVSYRLLQGLLPSMSDPELEGYEFVGYDKEFESVKGDQTYRAQYKKIDHLELVESPGVTMQNSPLKLDGKLKVVYADQSEKIISLNTDMVFDIDTSVAKEKTIVIEYCGLSLEAKVEISQELYEDELYLLENLESFIQNYEENLTYDEVELSKLISLIKTCDHALSPQDIRSLDSMVMPYYQDDINFAIDANNYDLMVSGMALAFDFSASNSQDRPLFKDTYRLSLGTLTSEEENKLIKAASGYGLKNVAGFKLSFYRNFESVSADFPMVISISLDDINANKSYAVYYLDGEEVYKCESAQSKDRIEFITKKEGAYMIYEVDTANSYDFIGKDENLTVDNADSFYLWEVIDKAVPLLFILVDELLIVGYLKSKKKGEKSWNDYKRSLQKADFVQDAKPKN